jgi:dTDP-4-amino-4,6-dideoxygalactose transaminase
VFYVWVRQSFVWAVLNLGRMAVIPVISIAAQHQLVENQLLDVFADHLFTQTFIAGEEIAVFEREFAQFCGVRYAVATNSGTMALVAALSVLNLRAADEVITTPLSFSATADAIVLAGGKPVFADVDSVTGNLDPKAVAQKISKKTKAVIVVHLYGVPAKMKQLREICKRANILLIEDASHAHGTEYGSQKVGGLADIGCFSLHPTKIIGALGNAGIITTSNPDWAAQIRSYCNHGLKTSATAVTGDTYNHVQVGLSGGMDAIQAAALRVKLPLLPDWIDSRMKIASAFSRTLNECGQQAMHLPTDRTSVYTYAFHTTERRGLQRFFIERQIETKIYYPTIIPLLKSYQSYALKQADFPIAHSWSQTIISIPLYQHMTPADQHKIQSALEDFFE